MPYDWHDGKGKVHSRRKGAQYRPKSAPPMDPYEAIAAAAKGLVHGAFGPAIKGAKADVKDARAQAPRVESAYDRSDASLTGSQQLVGSATDSAVAHQGGTTGLAQGTIAQLGGQQVAEASAAQQLYGQSADAAKIAATRAGAGINQLGAQGTDMAGFLGAMGAIQSGQLGRTLEASQARRGEARTELSRETARRKGVLSDLRVDRASKTGELASGMIKDERDYQLAVDTLNQRGTDSQRDYTAAMKTLGLTAARDARNDENTDAAQAETGRHNKTTEEIAAENAATARKDANTRRRKEKRARRADLADDGKINNSAGDASEIPKTTYKSGRAGVPSSPVTQTKLDSIRRGANGVRSQIAAGQRARSAGGDIDKALKAAGLKGNGLVLAKAIATGQKIPRSLIPYLAATIGVNQNELPNDIAKQVAR